ncbi:MAG TPA: MarR family transcriptional regulator [Pirellulaceae bacterium]|nr:MarR family transcriptional regulator [Pirellulaceae bacterium]HMO93906.1 MarR family transcriptional regulator [Pirellulaceae bacterium]HMP68944.1 MarR family transcriptional regulator [Pirellulaceae bacterium]
MAGKLKTEIKKQGAFDSLEQEAALNVLRTADQLHNRFGRLLRDFGLTPSQYNVLRILRGADQPLPSLEIADRLIQVVPAITGLIDRLEQQALVKRERSLEDRRVVHVHLTEKARKLLGQIDEPLAILHQQLMGHLSSRQLKDLIGLLEQARDWDLNEP